MGEGGTRKLLLKETLQTKNITVRKEIQSREEHERAL
jgi:hypothetical protein